ncbi:MAG: hypothetical protein JWM91_1456, partial [Rhodospirillales bacterium]|nr:hypothetical protein [Rhodospirillales bacterium]
MRDSSIDTPANDDAIEQPVLTGLAPGALTRGDRYFREILDALPAAV